MAEQGETAARLAALRAEYERVRAEATLARTRMLSDRLTHTRKQAQMREAQIEEADDQADYFAGRVEETEEVAHTSADRLVALEARAETVRGDILTAQIEDALAGFAAALHALAPQVTSIREQLEAAATHIQQAETWAGAVPEPAAVAPRAAITAATERYIAVEGLLRDLDEAVSSEQRATSE